MIDGLICCHIGKKTFHHFSCSREGPHRGTAVRWVLGWLCSLCSFPHEQDFPRAPEYMIALICGNLKNCRIQKPLMSGVHKVPGSRMALTSPFLFALLHCLPPPLNLSAKLMPLAPWSVKCLPCKPKDLSLIPRTQVGSTCNSITGQRRQGAPGVQRPVNSA